LPHYLAKSITVQLSSFAAQLIQTKVVQTRVITVSDREGY